MPDRHISVVLAGGGTAGHVNPLLSTADALKKLDSNVEITVVGTDQGLETELVPAAGYHLVTIDRVPFPRRINKDAITFLPRFGKSIKAAKEVLRQAKADVVVGFGGYVSTPVYMAAKSLNIPVIVHEGNARPGLANKLGARFAHFVALTFASTALKARHGSTQVIGLPMRASISDLADHERLRQDLRAQMLAAYNFDANKPVVVVTGGSLGALHLNEVLVQCAQEMIDAGIQVLHITGKGKDTQVREQTAHLHSCGYQVIDYLMGMEKAYALADLVITRAGAGMVAEVSGLGIPAVFVPLPIGNGEQALNAQDVVEAGGALMVADSEFTPQWLRANVLPLFENNVLSEMSTKARAVSALDGAQVLAQKTLEIAS
ncbi:UDP-N-acetylglucosamine--N-acetylmuramyl-(pentapeptide) pyrophosphoryl-undecaprenol N-acetylglucosamine transferase [Arcanobacterium pluranimalium]|uniref:undecaprenyldiphospho-muramoylpentapeptide beta-N-acetylglucosaminyltransferase n=1 Tax=Arcanobacterium pluranimalium TaxID=108028 RepID=UPI001959FC2D|nr:undecaprenyldiphospho-muramoylpentapeptide beta-N-acetylglucosaminyltransferase [Arcanobacterium pluranimalium]MBM7825594.1 UDP-N-acetylglucosamine--N-acetylmuramyl-(pentapeptide) pyrophosphoryl-undecaprenol N-acetylglucosamine transferase [Arcanobacterium pluranimalium]